MKRIFKTSCPFKVGLLAAALISLVVFAFPHAALADGTVKVSADGGTFTAYRIFTGNTTSSSLANPAYDEQTAPPGLWAQITGKEAPTAEEAVSWLRSSLNISEEATARKVGDAYDASGKGTDFKAGEPLSLPDGYYVITGSTKPIPMLVLVYDGCSLEIDVKASVPTLEKTVEGAKSAIAVKGRPLSYKLVGSLPANYSDYDSYYYAFEDELPEQMSISKDSVKVSYTRGDKTADVTAKAEVSIKKKHLSVTFPDLKSALPDVDATCSIIVEYESTLDDEADCGASNPKVNTAYIEYSNSPETDGRGKTHDEQASAYSMALRIVKADSSDNKPLEGAKFKLSVGKLFYTGKGWSEDEEDAAILTTGSDGTITIEGIPSGSYTLKETAAPTGYAKLDDDIEFSLGATLEASSFKEMNAKMESGSAAKVSLVDTAGGVAEITVDNDKSPVSPTPEVIEKLTSSIPKMGDNPLIVIAAIGVAGFLLVLIVAKRRNRQGEKQRRTHDE